MKPPRNRGFFNAIDTGTYIWYIRVLNQGVKYEDKRIS